jgi:hypothetical protein
MTATAVVGLLIAGAVYWGTGRYDVALLAAVAVAVGDMHRRIERIESVAEDLEDLVLREKRDRAGDMARIERDSR